MTCSVVKELMPNYIDGLTSDETSEDIKRHLASCESCCAVYEYLRSTHSFDTAEKKNDREFVKDLKVDIQKRKRRSIFSVFVILLIGILFVRRYSVPIPFDANRMFIETVPSAFTVNDEYGWVDLTNIDGLDFQESKSVQSGKLDVMNLVWLTYRGIIFADWMASNHNKGYFALDITSISSYSEFIDYIRWSYNRDVENLPQINLLMVTSEENHLPIYYRILSGSIKDVITINESLANFKFLGTRSIHLVMNKGFYSEPNMDALYESHYRFSVGVPFTASIATDAVEENRMGMDSHEHFINIGADDLYAVTKCIKWKGHRCYVHTYYDSLKAELENKKFTHRLLQCYDELTSHNERPENQGFYNKYFFVRDFPKRERKVQYNEEAIRRHKQNHIGWLVIISNKTKDATEALRSYRQKDAVEKGFDDLKNDLDMKRLRIHSNTAMEGRIFIQFISLILITYLRGIMEKQGWVRSHNLQEIFSEMKSLKEISVEGKRKKLVTTPTKFQREIMELYQVTM